ncbi:AP-1 complex subunit gamma-1 [Modicella reniformis]|uniref:AP-1 complex subunit gamma-1 n=1 Tax=Modicella reniformis TaxID=1440133 RepID=A0A9P6MH11_9FUNG|nr:AP-1 complex subunit gamma-1 [Modicella reniformis]
MGTSSGFSGLIQPSGAPPGYSGAPPGYSGFSSIGGSASGSGTGSPAFANSPQLMHQIAPQSASSRPSTPGYNPLQAQPSLSSAADSAFEDFDFVSNTGTTPKGPTTVVLLNKNGLLIELDVEYPGRDVSSIQAMVYFSNSLNSAMTMLTFRVAVQKSLQLQLNPQSSQVVAPFSKRAVSQPMSIKNPTRQQPLRIRYHVSYAIEGRTIEEQGEFNQFPSI